MASKVLSPILAHQGAMRKLRNKVISKRCSVCRGSMEANGYSDIPSICRKCA